jgi:hypothetical protein
MVVDSKRRANVQSDAQRLSPAGKAAASLVWFRCFVLFLALKEPIARKWRLLKIPTGQKPVEKEKIT